MCPCPNCGSCHFTSPFLADALARSEVTKGELEFEINRLKREEASLRDAALKLQAMIEGLGQEKMDLGRSLAQVGGPLAWTCQKYWVGKPKYWGGKRW